jgi:hypothetical protein
MAGNRCGIKGSWCKAMNSPGRPQFPFRLVRRHGPRIPVVRSPTRFEPLGVETRSVGGSQIDETLPIFGEPLTASVRANFSTAKAEISALQEQTATAPFLALSGGSMTGPFYLYNDPTDVMMPATKGYVDAHAGSGGGGGIPEAPADGFTYGRHQGAWLPVLKISGGTLTGMLTLSGPPVGTLDAATKAYVDAAPFAPLANPTFSGIVTAGQITAGQINATGYQARSGISGPAQANVFNIDWVGAAAHLWIDTTDLGPLVIGGPYAPLTNPAFAGTPTAPTAAPATNSTQLATTAYVKNQGYASGGPYLPTIGGTISGALTVAGVLTAQNNVNATGQVTAGQGVFDAGYRVYSDVNPPGNLTVTGNLAVTGTVTGSQGVLDAGYRVYSQSNPPTDLTVSNDLTVLGAVNIGTNLAVTGSSNAGQGVSDAGYRVYSPVNPPPALAALQAALATGLPGDILVLEVGAEEGEVIFRVQRRTS